MRNLSESLYGKYVAERLGAEIIETDWGYVTYNFSDSEAFIVDMFVDPAARQTGEGRKLIALLADKAIDAKKKAITGQIFVADKNCSNTLHAALEVGFKVYMSQGGIISIVKELGVS